MDRDEAIDLLCAYAASTGVLVDFDGTLSEIVDTPDAALPVEGAIPLLASLARSMRLVGVLSGRSLEDLRHRFAPPGVLLLGAYGRERSDHSGERPPPGGWEPVSIAAVSRLGGMPGVLVERKGAGVALHWRMAPELGEEVAGVARELADEFALEIRPGRLVAELIARGPGKGDALEVLVSEHGLTRLLYAGDDLADLEAFHRARAVTDAVLVAVSSEESPPELARLADVVVGSPRELVTLLHELASRAAG